MVSLWPESSGSALVKHVLWSSATVAAISDGHGSLVNDSPGEDFLEQRTSDLLTLESWLLLSSAPFLVTNYLICTAITESRSQCHQTVVKEVEGLLKAVKLLMSKHVSFFRILILKVWSWDSWGLYKTFSSVIKVKTIFRIILRYHLLFIALILSQTLRLA
jgi:hypothetical protein